MIIIVGGPSGVAKTYLCIDVAKLYSDFYLPKKHTTRPRRPGEGDEEYVFVSTDEFEGLAKKKRFLVETEIYGNRYGLSEIEMRPALKGHMNAIVVLDVFLAQIFKTAFPDVALVYVCPANPADLASKIFERSVSFGEDATPRLSVLAEELGQESKFDYKLPSPNFDVALQVLLGIIVAERAKRGLDPEKDIRATATRLLSWVRISVDIVVTDDAEEKVVLIRRKKPPFGWALPGGFVEYGESLSAAAWRELREETGLVPHDLRYRAIFANPDRDPRLHVISAVFQGYTARVPKGGGDAEAACWFSVTDLPADFVIDHERMLMHVLGTKESAKHTIERSLVE